VLAEVTSGWVILPIAVVLALVTLLGIAWYYFFRKRKPTTQPGNASEHEMIVPVAQVFDERTPYPYQGQYGQYRKYPLNCFQR